MGHLKYIYFVVTKAIRIVRGSVGFLGTMFSFCRRLLPVGEESIHASSISHEALHDSLFRIRPRLVWVVYKCTAHDSSVGSSINEDMLVPMCLP